MKTFKLMLTILVVAIFASCNNNTNDADHLVNPVIGDVSFVETFGVHPTPEANEDARVQTHLEYTEQLLRSKEVSTLTKEQKENRSKMLDLLNEYSTAGVFPRNHDYPDKRVPCFIDKDERICAVGYLIEKTIGRQAAEDINSKYKYDYVLAMNDPKIDDWVASSGLTKEEYATIQPTYGPVPPDEYVSPRYAVSSAVLGGFSLSLNTINGIQIAEGADRRTVPILGIATGLAQITIGAINYPTERQYLGTTFPSQRNVSLMNIGLGTSTVILSTWNLIANKKPKEKSLAWSVYGFPTENNQLGVGFSLTKKLGK